MNEREREKRNTLNYNRIEFITLDEIYFLRALKRIII